MSNLTPHEQLDELVATVNGLLGTIAMKSDQIEALHKDINGRNKRITEGSKQYSALMEENRRLIRRIDGPLVDESKMVDMQKQITNQMNTIIDLRRTLDEIANKALG